MAWMPTAPNIPGKRLSRMACTQHWSLLGSVWPAVCAISHCAVLSGGRSWSVATVKSIESEAIVVRFSEFPVPVEETITREDAANRVRQNGAEYTQKTSPCSPNLTGAHVWRAGREIKVSGNSLQHV